METATPSQPTPRIWQKGYLPPEVTRHNSDVDFHILKFPLGDASNFSMSRAAYALALNRNGVSVEYSWLKYAKWEHHYLKALREVGFGGDSETKAMGDQVSGIDGGYLAPEVWSQDLWGMLRNYAVLDAMPITKFTVPARITRLPKVSGDISIAYPNENSQITASQFKFGQVSYSARKAAALINIPNELMRDAPLFADQYLRREAAEAFATDRDKNLLAGQGGPNPVGLIYDGQITNLYIASTTAIGGTPAAAQPSYKNIGELIQQVENIGPTSNHDAGQVKVNGIITNSMFKQTTWAGANMADSSLRPMWFQDLNADGGMFGLKWGLSNVVPNTLTVQANSNCSVLIAGAWDRYVLMECLTLGFDATQESGTSSVGFAADETQVRIIHRYDGHAQNPEAFAILAGVLI